MTASYFKDMFAFILFILLHSMDIECMRLVPSRRIPNLQLHLTMTSIDNAPPIAVVGFSGSAAEVTAFKLIESGYDVNLLLDDTPVSPLLQKSSWYAGELDRDLDDASGKLHSPSQVLENRLVIVVGDSVADEDQMKDELAGPLFNKLSKTLPNSVKAIVCASGANEEFENSGLGNLFGSSGSSAFDKFVQSNGIPFSVVRYGKLTGGIPGVEPIPFVGMPLIEPEIHPSYVLRSVVLSNSDSKFSAVEPCTRDSLGETLSRLIKSDMYRTSSKFDAQVISIAGPPPSEKDWSTNFARLAGGSNVELLRMEFGEILKEKAFMNWIADQWFPQALIDADAATIIAGARPVKAVKQENGTIKIYWEDLKPDLSVSKLGEVEVKIENMGDMKALSVVRLSNEALQGESQLMDRLQESVNKNAFKKSFVSPLGGQ